MKEYEYRQAFVVVGHDLDSSDGLPEARILKVEARLACEVPLALRSFYLLAGRARSVLNKHDCFLLPEDWRLEGDRLVFLAGPDDVEYFAVDLSPDEEDPPVLWGTEDKPDHWTRVCDRCSEFLQVMVCWNGAFGGALSYSATGYSHDRIHESLEARYAAIGGITGMWAYGKPGLAICLDIREHNWQLYVGAMTDVLLEEVEDLDVTWERYG